MTKAALPALEPVLQPGEVVLFQVEKAATTVFDGPGGFLQLRMWEIAAPPPLGEVVLLGYVWKMTNEFVVGSMGREPLRKLLNSRAVEEMHVVQSLLDERQEAASALADVSSSEISANVVELKPEYRPEEYAWYGIIMAEAATTFSDGGGAVQQPEYTTLEAAKAWVLKKLAALLEAEEQVSQAVVLGPNGAGYDLLPSTWPHPGFEDTIPDWVEIEGPVADDDE